MVKLVCYNSSDELLELIYQWDANRTIKIGGFTINDDLSYQVHFSARFTRKAFVTEPTIESSRLVTQIPIELLERPDSISVYVYSINTETNEMQTIGEIKIPVAPRATPSDYVSEPTDGIIKVADGFVYEDGMLYLASNGVTIGTGIKLEMSSAGAGIAELNFIGADNSETGIAEPEEELSAMYLNAPLTMFSMDSPDISLSEPAEIEPQVEETEGI